MHRRSGFSLGGARSSVIFRQKRLSDGLRILALAEGFPQSESLPDVWQATLLRRHIEMEHLRAEAITGYLLNRDLFEPIPFEKLVAHLDMSPHRKEDEVEAQELDSERAMLERFRQIGRQMNG